MLFKVKDNIVFDKNVGGRVDLVGSKVGSSINDVYWGSFVCDWEVDGG